MHFGNVYIRILSLCSYCTKLNSDEYEYWHTIIIHGHLWGGGCKMGHLPQLEK